MNWQTLMTMYYDVLKLWRKGYERSCQSLREDSRVVRDGEKAIEEEELERQMEGRRGKKEKEEEGTVSKREKARQGDGAREGEMV